MFYFQVQAHNEVGTGPYTKRINISTSDEKPVPLLLTSSRRGMKVLDMDLQTDFAFNEYRSVEIIYSALERKIYWINEMWELISSDLYTGWDYAEIDKHIKITDLDTSAHNLCIDWIIRNLYWIESSNQTSNIMKLDLTLWQQIGIAIYDSIL
ncbi:proto-oncogene tyrosine-protein kinase ros [Lasius niger]|uniref:Proto-oncogene tyrosine-protein kinase ros n=1 Tax=Lasius niger TaxID=67767 RepID=A0A0J7MPI2_LASNI|nr:proto-oncogene tyrosine-protein kinase ros [Lasius niger]